MKKFSFIAVALAIVGTVSCEREIIDTNVPEANLETLTATIGEPDTKTTLESPENAHIDGSKIHWCKEDALSVFDGINNHSYTIKNKGEYTNSNVAVFEGEKLNDAEGYYALYPYTEDAELNGTTITGAVLPTIQTAVVGNIPEGAALSVAYTNDKSSISFKNVATIIGFTLAEAAEKVEFIAKGEESISGIIDITYDGENAPEYTVQSENGSNKVTLSNLEAGTYFFTILPDVTLSQGYELKINDLIAKTGAVGVKLERSKVYSLGELNTVALVTLQNALNAGGNVSLTSDVTVSASAGLSVPAGKTVTLDLGGNELTVEGSNFVNNGTLTITNGTVSGNDTQAGRRAIVNNGTLTLENVTVNQIYKAGGAAIINDGGTMIINEGTTVVAANMAISNKNNATLTINGGEFTGAGGPNANPSYCICNQLSSELTVNGGTFVGNHGALANTEGSVATLNAGTFKAEGERAHYAIYCAAQEGDPAHVTYHPTNVILDASTALAGGKKTIYVGNDGSTVEKMPIYLYVKNDMGWGKLNLYGWLVADDKHKMNGEWPGSELLTKETVNETDFYRFEIPEGFIGKEIGLILNNGTKQLSDYIVTLTEDSYIRLTPGTPIEIDPTDKKSFRYRIYVYDQANKRDVNIHYWGIGESNYPGVKINKYVDYDYKSLGYYEIPEQAYNGTTFNYLLNVNGDELKTSNLSIVNPNSDLFIGYWNNTGGKGFWMDNSKPYIYADNCN